MAFVLTRDAAGFFSQKEICDETELEFSEFEDVVAAPQEDVDELSELMVVSTGKRCKPRGRPRAGKG